MSLVWHKGYSEKRTMKICPETAEHAGKPVTFGCEPTPIGKTAAPVAGTQHQEELILKMSVKAMMLSAAISGLLGGTSLNLHASPTHAAGSKVFASGLNSLG
jgi:hypothetical protein